MIGNRLGTWIIDDEIGRGGMGRVYKAHEEPGTRLAAVKVLAGELAQDPGFLDRFQREIDILAKLEHPNIVRFFDAGEQESIYYYAMELVAGATFEELLIEKGKLHWKEVLDAGLQICAALKHAHNHGVIHRDLKPPNLIRSGGGVVKLMDFGIAKVFAGKQLTAAGTLVGTAEYLSPEQAAGKPVTSRSDLYSLGAVLYTLLTGKPPFEGSSLVDLLHKHRYAQFTPPRRLVPEIPHELDEIICNLLDKDPATRPASALVLQRRLESLQRKSERKEQHTFADKSDSITQVEGLDDVLAGPAGPGPGTLMSQLMRDELETQQRGGLVSRWLNRPWVLISLFAVVVGLIVWRFWPASDAADKASEAATPPAQWSEAERFVLEGERRFRDKDYRGAKAIWQDVVSLFGGNEADSRWVRQAERGLDRIAKVAPTDEQRRDAIRQVLAGVRQLWHDGNHVEAQKRLLAFETLYRNDPVALEVIAEVRKELEKKER